MEHPELAFGDRDLPEDLGIPALRQEFHMVLADHVQIIFVLRHHKVINVQKPCKLLQHLLTAELLAVEQKHAGVEVTVAVDAQALFNVSAVFLHLYHCLFMAGTHVTASQLVAVKLRNIAANDRIAVDIDRLVKLGEHLRNEKAVIGGLGIIVPDGKLIADRLQVVAYVVKANGHVFPLHPVNRLHGLRGDIGMKNMKIIPVLGGSVFQNGSDGNHCELGKTVIASVKNRYGRLVIHFQRPLFHKLFVNKYIRTECRQRRNNQTPCAPGSRPTA